MSKRRCRSGEMRPRRAVRPLTTGFRSTPIARTARPGPTAALDRLAAEPAVQIVGQGLGRRIAPARLLLQALEHDRLQVAVEPGRIDDGRGGSDSRACRKRVKTLSPVNGVWPVSRS